MTSFKRGTKNRCHQPNVEIAKKVLATCMIGLIALPVTAAWLLAGLVYFGGPRVAVALAP